MRSNSKYVGLMLLVFVALCLVLFGCTRPQGTVDFLQAQGYTEITITGYRPFMKSDSDTFSTGFRAKNQNGRIVTGAVCEGRMKGKTLRFD